MTVDQIAQQLRDSGRYDPYGYPRESHWICFECGQSLTWLSPPQAMARAILRHRDSAKHRKALEAST